MVEITADEGGLGGRSILVGYANGEGVVAEGDYRSSAGLARLFPADSISPLTLP